MVKEAVTKKNRRRVARATMGRWFWEMSQLLQRDLQPRWKRSKPNRR
jgi:hypothetical protein